MPHQRQITPRTQNSPKTQTKQRKKEKKPPTAPGPHPETTSPSPPIVSSKVTVIQPGHKKNTAPPEEKPRPKRQTIRHFTLYSPKIQLQNTKAQPPTPYHHLLTDQPRQISTKHAPTQSNNSTTCKPASSQSCRQPGKQAGRQPSMQAVIQAARQAGSHTGSKAGKQSYRQQGRQAVIQAARQASSHTGSKAGKQAGRQAGRHPSRQAQSTNKKGGITPPR